MHRSRAYFIPLIALVLALGLVAPAYAVTRSDVLSHQAKAAEARKQAAEASALAAQLQAETARLDEQVGSLQSEADALDPKIATAASRTTALVGEVESLRAKIAAKQATIGETKARYETEQGLLADKVESTYKQGNWFYFDLLLGSADIGDFITRTELVSRVIRANNDIAAQLADTRDELERAKVELDRSLETVNLKRKEAAAVESNLKRLQDARQSKVNQQQAVLNQKAELMADTKENADRLRALAEAEEAESDRIAAELAGGGSGEFNGVMAWPVPSSYRVTSPYGPRICPFHGRELHPGIDVGAPSGSPLVAASEGTVIFAGPRGSYGNTVMIDHGNGVVTLYAHQLSGGIRVRNGQKVAKGERIGTVGSTGNSTGPHLHFEVRVNGAAKNPRTYTG